MTVPYCQERRIVSQTLARGCLESTELLIGVACPCRKMSLLAAKIVTLQRWV
jgi:hypothetical protein